MGTGTPGSPVFFMEYAGARPRRRRLVPVKEEHNIRVTFSPNLIGSRDINLLPSDFNHYIVSLKRHLFLARYESIYQGDQYDIPEIDRDILQAIPDDSLKEYIPLAGDRFVLREFCKKGPKTKKNTLIKKLRKRLNIQKVDSDSDEEPVKKSHLIGNANAWKKTKKVSIGWLNYDVSASQFRQLKMHGGSTRKFDFHKDDGTEAVLVKGKSVFFPGGVSKIGHINDFEIELRDFSHELIKSEDTIEEWYDKTGVSMLRFYISTKPIDKELPSTPKNKELSTTHKNKELSTTPKNTKASIKPSALDTDQSDNSLPDPELDFFFGSIDNIPPLPPIEIFESDHELYDPEIAFRTDNVPRENNNDVTLRYVPNTSTPLADRDISSHLTFQNVGPDLENEDIPTSASLKIHRGSLSMMEMICYFKDPSLINNPVSIIRVLPNGEKEIAEDTGGVLRDVLSEFWGYFLENCTLGKTFKIPSLRHDFGYMEWKSVARIMMYGYKFSGYWPIQLAKTFMEQCIAPGDEIETKELMSDFYQFVSVPDREVFKKAVDDFSSVDIDELLDALETHECKARPTDNNIKLILKEIAHKEIIQAPKYIIDCWKTVFEETNAKFIDLKKLSELYEKLQPTNRKVVQILKFPDFMDAPCSEVSNYLKRFVKNLEADTLKRFLRFCTGSDLLTAECITIEFNSLTGLERRPTAHTCGCVLKLPKVFEDFMSFRSEFDQILEHNFWVMDII
ncbi:unnamed protein product [Mytilus edulis]|uniref:HECT domain-containing protein n=1 Tax=Mytilus edulis TaxID=6550 RepID=A0A8S3QAM7_MYTED|nr:unnamed protein product [Mytilus edulis]